MRFMILRKADADTEAGTPPSEELIVAMGSYVEELVKAGVMKSGDGLMPTSRGARVKFSAGKPIVTDGPFTEAKELIAGVSIYECASRAEAVEWVKRWPQMDGNGEVEIEIRQMYEMEDFGESEGMDRMTGLHEQMRG